MMTKENTKRKDRKLDKKQKQVQATESRKQYSSKNSFNSSSSFSGSFNGSKENGKDGDEYKSQCRMYEATMPVPGDFVMVQVKEHIEAGAYVSLHEYGGITGLILLEEASRLRARSISQVLQMGLQDVAVVIRTDPAKGYIDLSRKRVKSEERQKPDLCLGSVPTLWTRVQCLFAITEPGKKCSIEGIEGIKGIGNALGQV